MPILPSFPRAALHAPASSLRLAAIALAALLSTACGGGGSGGGAEQAQALNPALSLLAGSATAGGCVDGPAAQARFGSLNAVLIERDGAILVADAGCHAVRRIGPDGAVSTVAGQLGVAGDEAGPPGTARMQAPTGLARADDAQNRPQLQITDGVANRLAVLDLETGVLSHVALAVPVTQLRDLLRVGGDSIALSGASDQFLNDALGVQKVNLTGLPDTLTALTIDLGRKAFVVATPTSLRELAAPNDPGTLLAGDPRAAGRADGDGASARFRALSGLDDAGNTLLALDDDALRRIDISGSSGAFQAQVRTVLSGIAGLGQPRKLAIAADGQSVVFTTPTAVVRATLPAGEAVVQP